MFVPTNTIKFDFEHDVTQIDMFDNVYTNYKTINSTISWA